MEVKPGYKQTEVGVIPEEWNVKKLGELCTFTQGVQIAQSDQVQNQRDGYIRYLYIRDFFTDDFEWFVRDQYPSKIMAELDIMMVNTGNTAGAVYTGARGVLSNNAFRIRFDSEKLTRDFFFAFLTSPATQKTIREFANAAAQPHVGHKNIAQVPIGFPEKVEQRSIATALSDVDALLGGLDRLIAKKRDLKQAAMQQLLTGQTRLPGFHGEWEVKTFGELCDYVDGVPTTGGDLGYLEIGDVNVESKSYNVSQKEKPSVRGAVKVPAGTLLISTVRPTRGAIVITKSSLHVSSAFCRVRPVNGLLFHLVCQPRFLAYLGESSIGGTYPTCRDETILNYESALPSDHAEQTAIAEILSDMDAELAALEQRRDKTRALKQAMMQELLTGKTRLIAGAEAEMTA